MTFVATRSPTEYAKFFRNFHEQVPLTRVFQFHTSEFPLIQARPPPPSRPLILCPFSLRDFRDSQSGSFLVSFRTSVNPRLLQCPFCLLCFLYVGKLTWERRSFAVSPALLFFRPGSPGARQNRTLVHHIFRILTYSQL